MISKGWAELCQIAVACRIPLFPRHRDPVGTMTAKLIDGKAIAAEVRKSVKRQIDARLRNKQRLPGLAVILVGQDPPRNYMRNKAGPVMKSAWSRLGTCRPELRKKTFSIGWAAEL